MPLPSSYTPGQSGHLDDHEEIAAELVALRTDVDAAQPAGTSVLLAGDTMTGPLVLPGNPTLDLQAAPKQYVDTLQGDITFLTGATGIDDSTYVQGVADAASVVVVPAGSTFIVDQVLPPAGCTFIVQGTLQRLAGSALDLIWANGVDDVKIIVPPGGVIDGNRANITATVRTIRFDGAARGKVSIQGKIINSRMAAVIFREGCSDCELEDGYTIDTFGTGTLAQAITVFRGCTNIRIGTGTVRNPQGASSTGVLVDDGEQGFDTSSPCDGVIIARPRIFGCQYGIEWEGSKNGTIDAEVDGATAVAIRVTGGIDGRPSENVDIAATALVTNLAANADGVSICGKNVRDLGCTVDGVASGTGRGKVLAGEGVLAASVPSEDIYFGPGRVRNNLGAEALRLAAIVCNRLTVDKGSYVGGPNADAMSAGDGNGGSDWKFLHPTINGAGKHGLHLAPGSAVVAGLIVDSVIAKNVGQAAANTYDGVNIAGSGAFTKYARVHGVRAVDDQDTPTIRNALTVPSSVTFNVFDIVGSGILGSDVSGIPGKPPTFYSTLRSVSGGLITPLPAAKTGDYTVVATTDDVILCNGTLTVTLPSGATAGSGRWFEIVNIGLGVVTLVCTGGSTINGAASVTLPGGASVKVKSNGTDYTAWFAGRGSRLLDEVHADAGSASSSAEQTLATLVWPAGIVAAGDILRFRAYGDMLNNSGSPVTYTWRFKIGGTTVLATTATSFSASASRHKWSVDLDINAVSASSQRVGGTGLIISSGASDTWAAGASAAQFFVPYGTAAEDSSAALNVILTCQLGTSVSTADVILHAASLTLVKK